MLLEVFIAFVIALLTVGWVHSKIVRIARMKNIVDNPNTRKLQRVPIPVLGGVAVFLGIISGIGCLGFFSDVSSLLIAVTAMVVMLYVGTMDDILNLSPNLRFLIETLVVLLVILVGGRSIDDFHGLWGIHEIPYGIAIPLTVFASVGIINAINLIDGVNGLSSGFCIMACLVFGTLFVLAGDTKMAILASAATGALIPFFLHNVFGKTSRMFIGDGGTLMMGIVMSVFVINTLSHDSLCATYVGPQVGLIPFSLAVLCIPVFDTLRVMSTRMAKGISPFHPDKTHLHHRFIEMGCSHLGTTGRILTLNGLILFVWWILRRLGVSIDIQLYAVIVMGMFATIGIYYLVEAFPSRKSSCQTSKSTFKMKRHKATLAIRRWMDKI